LREFLKYKKRKKTIVFIFFIILVVLSIFFVYYKADNEFIILNIRLPRVLAGIVVGAMLGVSGAIMQGVLKNQLASPFTLGISHGALFGVSLSLVIMDGRFLFESAFLGAFLVIIFIFLLSLRVFSKETLILCGVAISALFSSGSMFLQYFASDVELSNIINWSFGDLSKANYFSVEFSFAILLFSLVYLYTKRWDFNAFEIVESENIGINVKSISIISLIIATLLSALSVSYFGIIGFIGLIAPHFARLVIGGSYECLFCMSAVIGAILLTVSDFLARVILYPIEIPVGIITSFIGAPIFLYLLLRRKN